MILRNVKIVGTDSPVDIGIRNGLIVNALSLGDGILSLHFENVIAFPGLINSHDHLDFNLFPQLGDKTYNNYTEWGKHIHQVYKDQIDEILRIPIALRAQWGIYKNLLGGVTTVVNHGEKLGTNTDIITVFEDTHSLHSVGFQKSWKLRLNNPLKRRLPVNIHVGEGNDSKAIKEVDSLTNWNLLHRDLIGVHAVAMTQHQAKKFKAIVWCPESNYFLLDKTASINHLKNNTEILFGTDSTLTGSWNIWNHLRLARRTKLLNNKDLYDTLTINSAKIWNLNSGKIANGKDADIVIARDSGGGIFDTNPADLLLVIHKGKIRLFDESLLVQLTHINLSHFSKIYIRNNCKYIFGDLPGLIQHIQSYTAKAVFPVTLNPVA